MSRYSMTWVRVADQMPKAFHVVLTQHERDLYPVPAYWNEEFWARETEGPEDSFYGAERHQALYRPPTHWRALPEGPAA